MRQLDCNTVYFDSFGRPLKGRVHFYVKGSTTDQAVYGSDGATALPNPMYTTNGRLSPQVFLQDKDYSVVWEQYVGNGTMTLDDETANWRQAGSAISLQPTVDVNITNVGLVCCENVAAVRALDPSLVSEGMITLLGYAAKGDKPAINYVWNSASTASDDGCTVIKPDGLDVGRWEIVAFGDMDCRHFGVFPVNTMAGTTSAQALAIAAAHRFAVIKNINISFPQYANQAVGYYLLNDGSYSHFYCQTDKARFLAAADTAAVITQVDDKPVYVDYSSSAGFTGTFKIHGSHLRSSYCKDGALATWYPSERFYIDTIDQSMVPTTLDCADFTPVFVSAASKSYIFKNMDRIEGLRLPSTISFSFVNCSIGDILFADPSTVDANNISMSGCTLDIANFSSPTLWVALKFKAADYVLDFGGRTVTGTLTCPTHSTIEIINGTFSNISISSPVVTLRGCTLTAQTFSGLAVLKAYGCTIGGTDIACSGLAEFHGCEVNVGIASASARCTVKAEGTSFTKAIYTSDADCTGCTFSAAVYSYANASNVVNFRFSGNKFASVHYIKGANSSTAYTVAGSWIGNVYSANDPIVLEDTVAVSGHSYTYEGNGGTAVPSVAEFARIMTDYGSVTATIAKRTIDVTSEGQTTTVTIGNEVDITITAKLFAIGRQIFSCEASLVFGSDFTYGSSFHQQIVRTYRWTNISYTTFKGSVTVPIRKLFYDPEDIDCRPGITGPAVSYDLESYSASVKAKNC